ncbi:MAG: BtpA/SgcQ family protein [Rhodobacteraceae bacterium]|nr:BtpA/SgcQ family protein [Paracoccaceae bacterium]
MEWIEATFGVRRPVIGMLHLKALPGDPGHDPEGGIAAVVAAARRDLAALAGGGVDGILISNEFSLPYLTETEPITAIAMARVIGELLDAIDRPFGVNVLWDGRATVDLAAATGAAFAREIFTGVYASDFGLWNPSVGAVARHHARIDRRRTRLLFNIVPEAAAYLGSRRIADIARTTVFNARPDGLCVSGLTAGAPTDSSILAAVREAVPGTPVLVNTGVRDTNVREQLAVADGAIVGTFFKEGGVFENPVDEARVRHLMGIVRDLRAGR